MMRRLMCAALAALLVSVALSGQTRVALASGLATGTGFTVAESPEPFLVSVAAGHEASPAPHSLLAAVRYESSRYRPRRESYRQRSYSRARGVSQLHAGYLDPDGSVTPGFVVGFRGGQQIDDMFQIGLGVDWRTKSGRATEVLQETTGPGGEVIRTRRDISKYSSNLFPGLAYVQLSGPADLGVVPYFGAAASWQVLFLSADDFQTGQSFDATYAGFGWQLWGGAALPLGGRSKLVGEVFLNNADLGRDVTDASGTTIRETVSTDGVGARFGLSWGF